MQIISPERRTMNIGDPKAGTDPASVITEIAWRGVPPPGQNKYFCGNLQIIMRFCETPNRTIALFTGHLRGTEGYGLQPLRPLASPKQKHSCHLERSETESKDPRVVIRQKSFRCMTARAGHPGHQDRLLRDTPGQNKYFCGNLQIITRFCETPSGPSIKPPRR